jgi:DNA-binding HxlR family transcriptional regulator
MVEKNEKRYIKMMCYTGSWEILKCIVQKGTAQYRDFAPFASTFTVNRRLKDFLDHNLIQHHFERRDVRKEWYEPTEKGREVYWCLRKMIDTFEKNEGNLIMNNYP